MGYNFPAPEFHLSLEVGALRFAFDSRDDRHVEVLKLAEAVKKAEREFHQTRCTAVIDRDKAALDVFKDVLRMFDDRRDRGFGQSNDGVDEIVVTLRGKVERLTKHLAGYLP